MKDRLIKPFKLLFEAFRNCWDEIWKSVFVLAVITILLATIFYWVEAPLQPEYGNWFQDVVWAFCVYIQDPGGIGGDGPITPTGKIIATILGFLNILIVAVPAGIIASGFTSALEEDSREKNHVKNLEKIRKSFKPELCRHTYLRVVPDYKSIASLQVKHGLTDDEIIGAVEFSDKDDLRLRNLADSYAPEAEAQDRLIVEMFPTEGSKDYGCYIDRGSNVTIVSTSGYSLDEIGSSRFGYLLAEFGGFNFMSHDFEEENSHSYYVLPADITTEGSQLIDEQDKLTKEFKQFFSDLKRLAEGKDHWVILINQYSRALKEQLCFVTKAYSKVVSSETTVIDRDSFTSAFNQIKTALDAHSYSINAGEIEFDKEHPVLTDLDTCFKPVGRRNISVLIGGGETTNVFTLRVASSLMVRDRRIVPIALKLAEIMRKTFVADDSYIEDHIKQWKTDGIKYR